MDDSELKSFPIWPLNFADVSAPKKNVAEFDNEWFPECPGPGCRMDNKIHLEGPDAERKMGGRDHCVMAFYRENKLVKFYNLRGP